LYGVRQRQGGSQKVMRSGLEIAIRIIVMLATVYIISAILRGWLQ